MKSIIKKIIKGILPYGIVYLINQLKNRQHKNENPDEPRDGLSPINSPVPPPPNVIPENLFNEYTLNRRINVLYWYKDNRVFNNKSVHNTVEKYNSVFLQLRNKTFQYYGNDVLAILDAFDNYSINGKDVIIWGLGGCNCEAIAVWKGARKVYVIDYNKPICDNVNIEVYNHEEFIQKEIKADFAVSYSSFEHDGLGRYGDPLSPDGDLRAMKEAHKYIKENGLLFLGVPLGQDCIVWNAHRIYGKNRLPLLFKGWQLIDIFDIHNIDTPEYPFDLLPLGNHIQNVMVLMKIQNDFPEDNYLLEDNNNLGKRNKLYKRINKVIYDFKKSL